METRESLIGKSLNFNALVEYNTQSIVSRSIIDDKVGRITLFAFDQGEKLSPHSTPYDALIQVVEGEAEVVIADVVHQVKQNEFIILPKNILHGVNANTRFKMLLTIIKSGL